MSQKRDWTKDHLIRKTGGIAPKESLNDLTEGAGKPMWSNQLQRLVTPERGKRIDPNSPEGQAIAARLKSYLT